MTRNELSIRRDFSLSLSQLLEVNEFRIIYSKFQQMLGFPLSSNLARRVERRDFNRHYEMIMNRPDGQSIIPQRTEKSIERESAKDRVFPLDTVELQQFRTKHHNADIDTAIIHTGPYADEYARSMNALAIAIARDIYFRNGAYRPETEEGRKTLAHELTHVAQYEEGHITNNSSREELEEEARINEDKEGYNKDIWYRFKYENKFFRLRGSEIESFTDQVAECIERKIIDQRNILSEEDYLKLLIEYETWLKEGRFDGFLGT
jgi:hypothetical protein